MDHSHPRYAAEAVERARSVTQLSLFEPFTGQLIFVRIDQKRQLLQCSNSVAIDSFRQSLNRFSRSRMARMMSSGSPYSGVVRMTVSLIRCELF